jgi:Lhr-like helicase
MIQFLTTILCFVLLAAPNAFASRINGLEFLGAGEAYYLKFIKVYNASLYVEPSAKNTDILSTAVSKCLHLEYEVSIKSEDFLKAANTILTRQFTENELAQVQREINEMHSSYTNVKSGDTYRLCYDSQTGETTLDYNDVEAARISSREFARVYFAIWLGNREPLDQRLRDNLLAGISSE